MGIDHHVVAQGGRWVVRIAGRTVASVHQTRAAAIEAGRRLAKVSGGALIVDC